MQHQPEYTLGDGQTDELQPTICAREEEYDLSGELERSQRGLFGALYHLGELHSLTNVVISTLASNTYDMRKL